MRSVRHELLDRKVVQVFAKSVERRAPENDLGDAMLGDVRGCGGGDAFAFEVHDGGAQIICELQVRLEDMLALRVLVALRLHMQHKQFAIHAFGQPGTARNQVARLRVRADADRDALRYRPVCAEPLAPDVIVQMPVDSPGHLLQGHLAECNEVAAAKEVCERPLDTLGRVDVAAPHPGNERLRRQVGDDDLVGTVQHPVRHLLANGHAGQRLHTRREAFDVLDVDGRKNVDFVFQQVENIFVTFVEAAAFHICVRKFVDQGNLWMARQNCVDVHLMEDRAAVLDVLAGHLLKFSTRLCRTGPAMRFHDADDYILTALCAAKAFAQHAVGFADTGRIPEKDFERPALLVNHSLAGREPVFRRLSVVDHRFRMHSMNSQRIVMIFRWMAAASALAGIVLVYSRWLHVNQTTVALTLLLLVLTLAANWSLRYAVVTALAATVAYNVFFLPPIGRVAIADSQNWLALFAFLVTAVVGSRLSRRARDQAAEARSKQREIELSLQLGRELLQLDNVANLLRTLPRLVARVTSATGVVLYLLDGDRLFEHGNASTSAQIPHLRQVALTLREPDLEPMGEARIPILAGVRPRGLLTMTGVRVSSESLQTIGGLVSISLDRAQALEDLARGEANKESERLRTLIIDSITHELRTPLTSIKGAASALRANGDMPPEARNELIAIVDEESDRLNLLVERATEMGRLDGRQVQMTFSSTDIADVIERAKRDCASAHPRHPVLIAPMVAIPKVWADGEFIQKVLCNLIENAAKYSPEHTPITVSARVEGQAVSVAVADRGYGIEPGEQSFIFERFYRARNPNEHISGSGMGLAISRAILDAHEGTIDVTSQPGSGSVFTFTLPFAENAMAHQIPLCNTRGTGMKLAPRVD